MEEFTAFDERYKAEYSVEADSFIERSGISDINLSEFELNILGKVISDEKKRVDTKCANLAKEIANFRRRLQDIDYKLKNGWGYPLYNKGFAYLKINGCDAANVKYSPSLWHRDNFCFYIKLENKYNLINLYNYFKLPHKIQEKCFYNSTEEAAMVGGDSLKKELKTMIYDKTNELRSIYCWGEPLIQQFLSLDIDRLMEGVI